jgi:hypothetical protein
MDITLVYRIELRIRVILRSHFSIKKMKHYYYYYLNLVIKYSIMWVNDLLEI